METPDPARRGALRGLRLALNTQTPLVKFHDEFVARAGDGPIDLAKLRQPDDCKLTTGGVTRMVFPLLRRWMQGGVLADAEWVAMAVGDRAPRLTHEDIRFSFVGLPAEQRGNYAVVKERLWALLNSNPTTPVPYGAEGLPEAAWQAFDAYQEASARTLAEAAERMGGVDLLYVHDFQQMGVGAAWRGPEAKKLFHLHTPFPTGMPQPWIDYTLGNLRHYDAVIVSTQRYARNLRAAGLKTPVHVIHPFIDPADYPVATEADARRFRETYGVAPDDRVILNVARMDPMKGQDRLLRALPHVLARTPEARLVLVGNGSFSSSRRGGLGLNKGQQWRASLEALAKELGVAERVTFTGHLDDALIPSAYLASEVFCLPSTREGFGLAAIEAWRHARPVVVSDRAGVAELVVDGENGRVIDCCEPQELGEALSELLRKPDLACMMGEAGLAVSERATLPVGQAALEGVFATLLEEAAPRARG